MEKVDLSKTSVAYFDDERVPDKGFYTLTGARSASTVKVLEAEWATEDVPVLDDNGDPTGETVAVAKTGPRGPVPLKIRKVDEVEVEHETEMTPDRRVYPSPDGDGFVWDEPVTESEDFNG